MFGRSSTEAAPMQPVNENGGRSAAISILPGMPLPHDLIQATPAPEPAPQVDAARELVSVGSVSEGEAFGAGAPAPTGFAVGTMTPPAPSADEFPAPKAKRASFSGLRR